MAEEGGHHHRRLTLAVARIDVATRNQPLGDGDLAFEGDAHEGGVALEICGARVGVLLEHAVSHDQA